MKINKKEPVLLIILLLVFIAIRSINYIYHVNWSPDQASCGIDALNLIRSKKFITLIGPQISANFQGHFIFQGPLITYLFLFFLLLGGWNPIPASYLFVIFASLMIFPLYFGVKKLINSKAAWIAVIIYSLVPYYINYSRFLWNSTFQFSLLPILIFLIGLYQQKKSSMSFLLLSIWAGILLQFHYQFVIVIFGLFVYYFLIKKIRLLNLFFYILGVSIGFSPLIIFELKHQFYHTKTLLLIIKNWQAVDRPGGVTTPHYYLTLSFLVIIILLSVFKKRIKNISCRSIIFSALMLLFYSFYLYIPIPRQAFWAPASPWNYLAEKKIYDIIRSTGLKKDFNVANLAYYDTKAYVIKYFMKRDGYEINYEDYYKNKYLFVINEDPQFTGHTSYEITTFQPRKIINQWKINEKFNLYLLERVFTNESL